MPCSDGSRAAPESAVPKESNRPERTRLDHALTKSHTLARQLPQNVDNQENLSGPAATICRTAPIRGMRTQRVPHLRERTVGADAVAIRGSTPLALELIGVVGRAADKSRSSMRSRRAARSRPAGVTRQEVEWALSTSTTRAESAPWRMGIPGRGRLVSTGTNYLGTFTFPSLTN